jgi:hypothetical protein
MIKKTKKTSLVVLKNLRNFILGLCLLATLPIFGQNSMSALKGSATSSTATFTKNVSVGLNIGLANGIGLDVAYRFSPHWAGKLGLNYAQYTQKGIEYSYQSTTNGTTTTQRMSFDAAVNISNLAATFEYTPGPKGRFKLIGGLTYFPQNTIDAGGQLLTTLKFNDVVLTPEDIGSGNVQIGFSQKISPYIGMGIGRTFPRKRLNLSLDLGTQYKGDYKVKINVKPGLLLKQNEDNAAILERNFNEKWYGHFFPVLNLRLAYLIK